MRVTRFEAPQNWTSSLVYFGRDRGKVSRESLLNLLYNSKTVVNIGEILKATHSKSEVADRMDT